MFSCSASSTCSGGGVLEFFVFDELTDQFPARVFAFLLAFHLHLLVHGQQFAALDIHERRGHDEEFAGDLQIELAHEVDVFDELRGEPREVDLINVHLIKKEEVDIYEVNLTRLATQFIEYIDLMRQFDLEIAGEFLVMASTLMYIKSRELLPVDQQVQVEGEEEGEDPRWELIRQLVEYKKFKDAAARLQVLEAEQENIFPRLPGKLEFESAAPPPKPDVSIFDLLNAVNGVLQRFARREDRGDIFEDKWSVSEKIESILRAISGRGSLRFAELFESAASRSEVVCTFLALLELIRLRQLVCSQPEAFGEIEIRLAVAQASRLP